MRQRQEVVNVVLAQLLAKRGLLAAPEQVHHPVSTETMLPDVIVDYHGLRMAIEAEFNIHGSIADRNAYAKAKERVDTGLAHIGLAVVYPAALQTASFASLPAALTRATLRYAIVTEVNAPETQLNLFDAKDFTPAMVQGSVDDLVDMIHRSYSDLAREDTVTRRSRRLSEALPSCLGQQMPNLPWESVLLRLSGFIQLLIRDRPEEVAKSHSLSVQPSRRSRG
jgi:hypothetical protein